MPTIPTVKSYLGNIESPKMYLGSTELFTSTSFNTKSLFFNGTDEYLQNNNKITESPHGFISIWFKQEFDYNDTQRRALFCSLDTSNDKGFYIQRTNDNYLIFIGYGNVGSNSVIDGVYDNNWHHLLINKNVNFEIYLDGIKPTVLLSSNTNRWTSDFNMDSSIITTVGRRPVGGTFDRYWDGKIDEISIGNVGLTESQISEIYNNGNPTDLSQSSISNNLIHWWRMGDVSTLPLIEDQVGGLDLTSNNMNALNIVDDVPLNTFSNTKSLSFNGTDEYLTGTSDEILSQYSISVWFKPIASQTGNIFYFDTTTSKTQLFVRDDYSIDFINLPNGDLTNNTYYTNPNEWNHVLITSNGSNYQLYLNNTKIQDQNVNLGTLNLNYMMGIGGTPNGQTLFDGKIDEFSMFNQSLTELQSSEIYNNGTPTDLSQSSMSNNLIHWWKMENTPVIEDQVGNLNLASNNMDSSNIDLDVP